MHRALSARWLNRALNIGEASAPKSVPLFLCPAVGYGTRLTRTPLATGAPRYALCARRLNHTEAQETTANKAPEPVPAVPSIGDDAPQRKLPLMCSGCGAFTQTSDPTLLGHFDANSKRIRRWTHPSSFEREHTETEADQLVDNVLKSLDRQKLDELG